MQMETSIMLKVPKEVVISSVLGGGIAILEIILTLYILMMSAMLIELAYRLL